MPKRRQDNRTQRRKKMLSAYYAVIKSTTTACKPPPQAMELTSNLLPAVFKYRKNFQIIPAFFLSVSRDYRKFMDPFGLFC